jgi:CubicO group peptidase (beta-lactamase class C family)
LIRFCRVFLISVCFILTTLRYQPHFTSRRLNTKYSPSKSMNSSLQSVILLAILFFGICFAGCTTAPSFGTDVPESQSYITASSSPAAGRLNDTIAQFDRHAQNAMLKWNVPGMAVAIVKDGEIIFARGYGVKTAGGSDPVTTDTVFQIGSTSKAFTAALAAMEVDSGRMNWTDPVIRYLPDFRMNDPWVTKEFTITDTLSQRSGLDEKWGTDLATLGYSRSEMIHALRYAEPISSFRSEYAYQNIPFMVTAAAVEKTSGKSWEENLEARIFTPLHMESASTSYEAFLSAPDHATLHMLGLLPDGTLGPVLIDPGWEFNNMTYTLGPAGGINADVKDMAAWAIFQLGDGTFEGKTAHQSGEYGLYAQPEDPGGRRDDRFDELLLSGLELPGDERHTSGCPSHR